MTRPGTGPGVEGEAHRAGPPWLEAVLHDSIAFVLGAARVEERGDARRVRRAPAQAEAAPERAARRELRAPLQISRVEHQSFSGPRDALPVLGRS